MFEAIRASRINFAAADVEPFRSVSVRTFRSDAVCLFGSEDHVTQTLIDEQRECGVVCRGFGQPKRFRFAAEAKAKIGNAPQNLCQSIALVAERQDRVAV